MKASSFIKPIMLALLGCSLLAAGILLSISFGAADIRMAEVWNAITNPEPTKEQLIVRTLRLPRALGSALIGASLAVAGALMQAVTRNPLASPQIFGINAGASLVVVGSIVLFPFLSPPALVYFAFAGAALGGGLVYSFGSAGGQSPVKLALAGTAVSLLLAALTEGLVVLHDHQTQTVLFWLAGAVDGVSWSDVHTLLPWSLLGLLVAAGISRSMTLLGLGDDVAHGLGQRVQRARLLAGVAVILLAGSSVAVAGPIGFIGLVIPHIVRRMVGSDYRMVIPFAALFGAVLLVYADLASRYISYPFESPVGIVTAALGAPFFLYLIHKGRMASQ